MRLHLLSHLLEDFRRIGGIPVLDALVYQQFNIHIKTVYYGPSRRRALRI